MNKTEHAVQSLGTNCHKKIRKIVYRHTKWLHNLKIKVVNLFLLAGSNHVFKYFGTLINHFLLELRILLQEKR